MTPYLDLDGDSVVMAFEVGAGFIDIRFKHGGTYRYEAKDVWARDFAEMVRYAETGNGLNSFINRNKHVKEAGRKLVLP